MMGNPPQGGLISNGHHTTPVEVSAAILAKLARDASARLGFGVREAVITVPAHFGDKERSATAQAATMAGLTVLKIINEPTAAALAYTKGEQPQPGVALVFDLGGGTFDATLLQLGEGVQRVLSTSGIEELGGLNFTIKLAEEFQRRYKAETNTAYPTDLFAYDQLMEVAEKAKCELSDVQTTTVHLAPASGVPVELVVTRKQFANLLSFYLLQLETSVDIAIERAGKTLANIDRVLLCGGSSRIPAVQNMLTQHFGRRPESILDLDLSVALGAAYEAARCESRAQKQQEPGLQIEESTIIIDCVSYPVGIAVKDPRGEPTKLVMLRTGDRLGAWSSPFPVRIVGASTAFPPIAVYQGEGTYLDPKDKLGDIVVTLPPNTPNNARASVMMCQDQNGLIQIHISIEGRDLQGNFHRVTA